MSTRSLRILSGGAAQGLVRGLQTEFEAARACAIDGHFGTAGAMRDRVLAGEPCDLVILTHALLRELADQGQILAHTARTLGTVKTGVAVCDHAPPVAIGSAQGLKSLLERAGRIYLPDPARSTAGSHFMRVLRELGLAERAARRLHVVADGASAMQMLASSADDSAAGCAQATEILGTPGVRLVAPLPPPYELATTYAAAICTRSEDPQAAQAFIELLAGDSARPLREIGGFDVV